MVKSRSLHYSANTNIEEKEMRYLLDVLDNGVPLTLCFVDRESAKRFLALTEGYLLDAEAGNDHGAYSPISNQISEVDSMPASARCELEGDKVWAMIKRLARACATDQQNLSFVIWGIGREDGAIIFRLGELPTRTRLGYGDRYRVARFDGELLDENEALEGVVVGVEPDGIMRVRPFSLGNSGLSREPVFRVRAANCVRDRERQKQMLYQH